MNAELPAEISRFMKELDDFEAKLSTSSELHQNVQTRNMYRSRSQEKQIKDHNCQYPVHKCYCGGDESLVKKTQLRTSRNSCPKETTKRTDEKQKIYEPYVQKSDLYKKNKKDVYDVENARVTVEVKRDNAHSPPTKLTRRHKSVQNDISEDERRIETPKVKKRWAEILQEQNSDILSPKINDKKIYSNKKTQYEDKPTREKKECSLTTEASLILNELKKKSDSNGGKELKLLLGSLEKILKKLDKKIPTIQVHNFRKNEDFDLHIERSYQTLEASCKQLEESCLRLKKERDSVKQELCEKNNDLQKALLREIEFKNKLSEANSTAEIMAEKIEKYSESTRELTSRFAQLQEGTRELGKLQRQVIDMSTELENASLDNNKLKTELELVKLERDKIKLLLTVKDEELIRLKKEVMMIGDNVTQQAKGDFRIDNSTAIDLSGTNRHSQFFCSSPNTTSSEESPIAKSWKRLSSIVTPGGDISFPLQSSTQVKKPDEKKVAPMFTKVISLGQSSPERLKSLRNELKQLFVEMKNQAELAIEQDDTSASEMFKLTHTSSWTQLTNTSHSHSDSADMSDIS